MHKYQPRIHLIKVDDVIKVSPTSLDDVDHKSFIFPETTFIAVTAYQNQLVSLQMYIYLMFNICLKNTQLNL